jgi:hypothetical protein
MLIFTLCKCPLPTAHYPLTTTHCPLPTAHYASTNHLIHTHYPLSPTHPPTTRLIHATESQALLEATCHFQLGNVYRRKEQPDDAIRCYKAVYSVCLCLYANLHV